MTPSTPPGMPRLVRCDASNHALRFAVNIEPLSPANTKAAPREASSKSQAGANAP